MDMSIMILFIPMSIYFGYLIARVKRKSIKVEAICTGVDNGVQVKIRVYHGTYKFCINGKEYEIYDENGSNLKPKINVPIYIYVKKDDFLKIVPQIQIRLYQWLIGLMLFFSAAVVIKEIILR